MGSLDAQGSLLALGKRVVSPGDRDSWGIMIPFNVSDEPQL